MENKIREQGIVKTSIVGIIGNIVLVAFKAFVGFLSGSIAIVMDALNNFTDALSSIVTIIGTKLSGKKPTKEHPFGFGRVEYITSIIIGAIILFAGGTALYESIVAIIDYYKSGTKPEYTAVSVVIISVAMIIKIAIGLFFVKKSRKFSSEALKASGYDALLDSVLSFSTIIGMVSMLAFNFYIEGYISVLISIFILKTGFEVVKEALDSLIGVSLGKDYKKEIKEKVASVDGVLGVYDLILNTYGNNKVIGSVHVGVRANMTTFEIQKLERAIATILYMEYGIIMTVGIYVEDATSENASKIKRDLLEITKDYSNIHQVHGFFVDEDNKVIGYDLVFGYEDSNNIQKDVDAKLKEKHNEYTIASNIDYEY